MPTLGNIVAALNDKYNPAYIQVINANGGYYLSGAPLNPNPEVPFKLNEPAIDIFGNSIFRDYKDLNDEPAFWAHTVVFAYQPPLDVDKDPNSESVLLGGTPKLGSLFHYESYGYSVIYLESIREMAFDGLNPFIFNEYLSSQGGNIQLNIYKGKFDPWLFGTIAHELGHAPGRQSEGEDHAEHGLMQDGGATIEVDFNANTIKRFRSTQSWSQ